MISMRFTEHYLGMTIMGSQLEFMELVDVFYDLSLEGPENDEPEYHDIRMRVLGLCYDIRHASMGHRDVKIQNMEIMNPEWEEDLEVIDLKGAICSFNYLYPELCYVMVGLNSLIELRSRKLTKSHAPNPVDPRILWDPAIAAMRQFQSGFYDCLKKELTANGLKKFGGYMVNGASQISSMHHQYVDMLNTKFMKKKPAGRKKQLVTTMEKIAEYYHQEPYLDMKFDLEEASRKLGEPAGNLRYPGLKYPEEETAYDW